MGLPGESAVEDAHVTGEVMLLRLYIAGKAPNSLRAVANLLAICENHFPGRFQIETVDVLREPLRALADDILITPTLVKVFPLPGGRVFGDLSDQEKVLLVLRAWVG